MPELPSGTVTFLFTDVEGSTKLLHGLGAKGYAAALAEHRPIVRDEPGHAATSALRTAARIPADVERVESSEAK